VALLNWQYHAIILAAERLVESTDSLTITLEKIIPIRSDGENDLHGRNRFTRTA
jgi:hypothetical protein